MATSTVQHMFVGGSWQLSASGETFEARSPATGEFIGSIPQGDRGDAVRAFSGTTTFFVALFAAIVLSQARARPRWTAARLVAAVGVLVAVGLVGDLVLGRVFGTVFFAIVNVPVLLTASMLALGGAPRAAT